MYLYAILMVANTILYSSGVWQDGYKINQVKRERLIELVTDLERMAKKISQKFIQIQVDIVD